MQQEIPACLRAIGIKVGAFLHLCCACSQQLALITNFEIEDETWYTALTSMCRGTPTRNKGMVPVRERYDKLMGIKV